MATPTEGTAASAVPTDTEQPLSELARWWQQSGTLVNDELEIVALEGERVASSLVSLLLFNLLAGLFALSLWFSVLSLLVWYLLTVTESVPQALGWSMLLNLAAFWWLLRRCRYYSSLLCFPATRQSLRQLFRATEDKPHV